MELGISGGFADERIIAAYQAVCDACRTHGKFAGAGLSPTRCCCAATLAWGH
jgi:hypothetical protein